MGCGQSSSALSAEKSSERTPANLTTKNEPEIIYDMKAIHSAIRWNKDLEEIKKIVLSKAGADSIDSNNGNAPVHIAAQNGHLDIVLFLIKMKADLNVQNLKGNTAIHMAIQYDYYECAKSLIDAGADKELVNSGGWPSYKGIDGDKTFAVAALISATNPEQLENAFTMCEKDISNIEKANFVSAGLKAKKALGSSWTPQHQDKFKSIMSSLP